MVKTKKVFLVAAVFILFMPVFVMAGAVDLPETVQAAIQTHFEEDDPAIAYSGTWNSLGCSPCSNGLLKYSGQTGAKAEFSFYGTGIRWTTAKAPSLGKAKIYFNGVYKGMVDLYSPNVQYPVVLEGKGLPAGNYTLRIEVSGQKNPGSTGSFTLIDSFDVYPDDPIPAAPVISLVNAQSINEANVRTAMFDWLQEPFAMDYKMYCRKVHKWGNTEYLNPFVDFSENVSGSGAQIDFASPPYGFCDDNLGDGDGVCEDYETFEYDALVENNDIQLAYDCYVTGVSAYQTEGPASNIVRVEDKVGPRLLEYGWWDNGETTLTCPSTGGVTYEGIPINIGSICGDPSNPDEITGIVLQYDEEVRKEVAETASNYTFTNLVTGATAAVDSTPGAIYYDPSSGMVLLSLSDTLNWRTEVRGVGIPVIRTGPDGMLQTATKSGSDDIIPYYIGDNAGNRGGVIGIVDDWTWEIMAGPCVVFGANSNYLRTIEEGDDVLYYDVIWAGSDGKCSSRANNYDPSGDDIQVVAVGAYSGVCGIEGSVDVYEQGDDRDTTFAGSGLILAGYDGICSTGAANYAAASGSTQIVATNFGTPHTAGIVPGWDGILNTTTISPTDVIEDATEGTAIKVLNVKDIAGNVIQTTGDEYTAGGVVK
ncbi:MAG TPA: hypothetical protein VFF47_05120 [Nitrospirota bacterium]|nr:hypothetical protein [Nitrospirota bacterium]